MPARPTRLSQRLLALIAFRELSLAGPGPHAEALLVMGRCERFDDDGREAGVDWDAARRQLEALGRELAVTRVAVASAGDLPPGDPQVADDQTAAVADPVARAPGG